MPSSRRWVRLAPADLDPVQEIRRILLRSALVLLVLALLVTGAAVAGLAVWRQGKLAKLEARSQLAQTHKGLVEYAAQGNGPAVLVLHGGFGGFDQGLIYLPGLAESGCRVIAPSRPGYLRTPLATGRTNEEQADAMAALLDTLGVRRAVVAGISAGGPVALQFALRHPERTGALILACAITRRTAPELPGWSSPARWGLYCGPLADLGSWQGGRAVHQATRQALGFALRRFSLAPLEQRAQFADAVLADPAQRVVFEQLAESTMPLSARLAGLRNDYQQLTTLGEIPFEQIRVPTLIVHGTVDRAVPFDHAELAAARLPKATLCRLEGADHLLLLGPQREEIRRAVGAFLSVQHPPG